jgi:hypothetical protein
MNAKELSALLESELKQHLTENISKGYTVVYRDKAFDKTYTAQIPPGISKAEIVKMLKKTIRVGLEIVGITPLKEGGSLPTKATDFDTEEERDEYSFEMPDGSDKEEIKALYKTDTERDFALHHAGDGTGETAEPDTYDWDDDFDEEAGNQHKDKDKKKKGYEPMREGINEAKSYVVIDPKGNASPVGSKIQGQQFIKGKKGYYVVLAKNATKARRAIEKAGGRATSRKVQDTMDNLYTEGAISPKAAKKLSIGDTIKTQKNTYKITGYGNRSNAFRQFEAEDAKGNKYNIQVSLRGNSDIGVASGRSLRFSDEMLESTKAYGDALKAIEREKTLKALSKKDKDTLQKLAALMKQHGMMEANYKVAGRPVKVNQGKKSDGTDWTVTFKNGKSAPLSDVLALIKPFPKGIKEGINEAVNPKKAANAVFDKLAASRLIGKQYRARAVAVIANIISSMKLEGVNEDRFGHPITAQGNQTFIQLNKLIKMLSGTEKREAEKAFIKMWRLIKRAMEAEEQK